MQHHTFPSCSDPVPGQLFRGGPSLDDGLGTVPGLGHGRAMFGHAAVLGRNGGAPADGRGPRILCSCLMENRTVKECYLAEQKSRRITPKSAARTRTNLFMFSLCMYKFQMFWLLWVWENFCTSFLYYLSIGIPHGIKIKAHFKLENALNQQIPIIKKVTVHCPPYRLPAMPTWSGVPKVCSCWPFLYSQQRIAYGHIIGSSFGGIFVINYFYLVSSLRQ